DVDVARSTAAALGEEDQREALLLDDFEQPIFLVMVGLALRAGQHRVVVVRDGDTALVGPNSEPLTRPTPVISPSAGVRAIRSSAVRRVRWLAIAKAPHSINEPGSSRSSRFCRAVRWLVLRRRPTAS